MGTHMEQNKSGQFKLQETWGHTAGEVARKYRVLEIAAQLLCLKLIE